MTISSIVRSATLVVFLCVAFPVSPQNAPQKTFATPEEAVVALVDAIKAANTNELLAIFGPEGENIISSGDPVMDRRNREVFLVAYDVRATLTNDGTKRRILSIGNEDWPFPIPLAKEGATWRFDTAAGAQEMLFRRIGRDELSIIRVCQVYVEAQNDYAATGHDGYPAGLYAQRIASTPGKHDGLYWKSENPEPLSPLGAFAAAASADGYAYTEGQPAPYYGYYFRILTSQGKSAQHGARTYLINGEMRDGFALIAHPAVYRVSGVMTFIVNQDGVVYQKDLGPETEKIAAQITQFDPGAGWKKVE